jgi:DNA-binding response OmpR family regulator
MNIEPRILILENNDALRVLLFTILRRQPLAVDTALRAREALEKASNCDYALIVVDADMADDEAIRFVSDFREQRPEAKTFVLAVRDPNNDTFLDPTTINAVMNKPLEIDTVAELVRECAHVIPPPEDPLPCPPSESEIRSRMERGSYQTN